MSLSSALALIGSVILATRVEAADPAPDLGDPPAAMTAMGR